LEEGEGSISGNVIWGGGFKKIKTEKENYRIRKKKEKIMGKWKQK
jgi:hypothetical protein